MKDPNHADYQNTEREAQHPAAETRDSANLWHSRTMMFDVWRMREQGWLLPRFRSCMVAPVRAVLRLTEQRDHALNRHIRVAELLDPRTRQTIGNFPPLLDAALVALDETSMTLTGTERIEDSQATREYLYAQSWFLQAVWGSHPCLYSDRD